MIKWKVKISEITDYGKPYLISNNEEFITASGFEVAKNTSIFIVKTKFEVHNSTELNSDTFVIAFSNTCTHMGCSLIRNEDSIAYDQENSQISCGPCPCHGTTFDLNKQGLVILGPATQNLPQLLVELSSETDELIINDWIGVTDPTFEKWPN